MKNVPNPKESEKIELSEDEYKEFLKTKKKIKEEFINEAVEQKAIIVPSSDMKQIKKIKAKKYETPSEAQLAAWKAAGERLKKLAEERRIKRAEDLKIPEAIPEKKILIVSKPKNPRTTNTKTQEKSNDDLTTQSDVSESEKEIIPKIRKQRAPRRNMKKYVDSDADSDATDAWESEDSEGRAGAPGPSHHITPKNKYLLNGLTGF